MQVSFPSFEVALLIGSNARTPASAWLLSECTGTKKKNKTIFRCEGKESLRLRFRGVLLADGGHSADVSHDPEHVGSNVGTAGVVAEILAEQFFASV
jgi:hypothetical protein